MWCATVHDKRIPVDVQPVEDGNLVVFDLGEGRVLATQYDPAVHANRSRFKSHFATCPKADQFRKAKPTKTKDQAEGVKDQADEDEQRGLGFMAGGPGGGSSTDGEE